MICFNPHTHEGCDLIVASALFKPIVSIHTPTKGVTYENYASMSPFTGFNPHTHEGCDYTFS